MVRVVLVGPGNRGNVYARYALEAPDKMQVVGIVEPDVELNNIVRERYNVPVENCFYSVDEFVKRDKFADAVINATMDDIHVVTSIPILRKGYHMLLEKPFAINEPEMRELLEVVEETGRMVYICHVLRYAPFYASIKEHLINGDIGDIIAIQQNEHVSYHHIAVSFVRGKWRSEKICGAPMILAKCCHDIDIMMWMMSHTEPYQVSSFGSDFQFGAKNKPENAGKKCMVDCPLSDECIFAAEQNYVSPRRWQHYTSQLIESNGIDYHNKTFEEQAELLREVLATDSQYGGCVWDCERDGNVDHQVVTVNFKNGAVGTLNMVGGTARPERNIHIVGTKGEIKGEFESQKYVLRKIDPKQESGYIETEYDMHITGDSSGMTGSHGNGDIRLIADFCDVLEGKEKSLSCTDIMDSTKSLTVTFKAEESRKNKRVVLY